ncbi:MAG: hypothetical protein U1E87_10315 [Alphaproteobacteria bacterium]
MSDRLLALSGEVLALSMPFSVPGAAVRESWAEFGVGLSARTASGVTLHASFGGSSDGDTAPSYAASLGAEFRF